MRRLRFCPPSLAAMLCAVATPVHAQSREGQPAVTNIPPAPQSVAAGGDSTVASHRTGYKPTESPAANATDGVGKAHSGAQAVFDGAMAAGSETARKEAEALSRNIGRVGDGVLVLGTGIGAGTALANGDPRAAAVAVGGSALDKGCDIAIEGACAVLAAAACAATEGAACPAAQAAYAGCLLTGRTAKLGLDVWLASKGYANSVGELAAKCVANFVDPLEGPEPLASFTAPGEPVNPVMQISRQSHSQSTLSDGDTSMSDFVASTHARQDADRQQQQSQFQQVRADNDRAAAAPVYASAPSSGGDDGTGMLVSGLMHGVVTAAAIDAQQATPAPLARPSPASPASSTVSAPAKAAPQAPSGSGCRLTDADLAKGRVCTSK